MKKLFGTDGIRNLSGQFPLRASDVLKLGQSAGSVLRKHAGSKKCRVIMVRDTRASGQWIAKKLAQGLRDNSIDVFDAGVLSTPSCAYLVRKHKFQSGVVISASHNPPEFNGIKFFDAHSCKWPDTWEKNVEKKFFSPGKMDGAMKGRVTSSEPLAQDYEDFLVSTLKSKKPFAGLSLVLDCSHGANFRLAPRLFNRLGAKVLAIGSKPDGKNINVNCGSQHPEELAKWVKKKRAFAGVAYDGDGDRVVFVDEKGQTIDGDFILAILARYFKDKKMLRKNTVVTTVMANLGLKKFLKDLKVRNLEVAVGDRYVSEGMRKKGAALGGEQSGHIILGDYLPTGDGLLTSLHVLAAARFYKKPLSELAAAMKKYPQVLLNVRVKEKIPIEKMGGVKAKIEEIGRILGEDGRVLVRYSGTEPLLRIMLEGPEKKQLDFYAGEIAHAVTRSVGE